MENPANPQYYYFRHDHLGDNREVWCANTNTVAQRTQYYPSGLPWAYDRTLDHPDLQHRKYNGKEFVEMHGYDTYDIVWRQYYPAIGRFQTQDPEIEDAYAESPYSMCDNNMVNRIDPNGRFWWLAVPIVVGLLMEAEPVNAPTLDYKSNNAAMKQAWSEHNMGVISNFIPGGEEVAVSTRVAVKTFIKQEVKQEVKQEAKKTFQTYIKEAKDKTKDSDYSGRTSGSKSPRENVAKRDTNHHMNETHGPAKLDKSSTNPNAIRGREQQNTNKRGGAKSQNGTSGNKINGVSPNNKNEKIYEQAAKKEFGK